MKRRVLVIPLDEIERQFQLNKRQDVKIIAPEILSTELYERLTVHGQAQSLSRLTPFGFAQLSMRSLQ